MKVKSGPIVVLAVLSATALLGAYALLGARGGGPPVPGGWERDGRYGYMLRDLDARVDLATIVRLESATGYESSGAQSWPTITVSFKLRCDQEFSRLIYRRIGRNSLGIGVAVKSRPKSTERCAPGGKEQRFTVREQVYRNNSFYWTGLAAIPVDAVAPAELYGHPPEPLGYPFLPLLDAAPERELLVHPADIRRHAFQPPPRHVSSLPHRGAGIGRISRRRRESQARLPEGHDRFRQDISASGLG